MRTCWTRWRQARRGELCTSGDTSCYGAIGPRSITEDEPLGPPPGDAASHPPSIASTDMSWPGLPIVTALPGWVYGNGSWFRERVIAPVMAGRPRGSVWEERAVGVAHSRPRLCPRNRASRRARRTWRPLLPRESPESNVVHEFAETFARLARRPLRVWRVPTAATRLVVGPLRRRPHPSRRCVLEHPTTRDAVPLSVSHAQSKGSSKSSERSIRVTNRIHPRQHQRLVRVLTRSFYLISTPPIDWRAG